MILPPNIGDKKEVNGEDVKMWDSSERVVGGWCVGCLPLHSYADTVTANGRHSVLSTGRFWYYTS